MDEGKDELEKDSPAEGLFEVFAQEVAVEEGAVDDAHPHVEEEQAKVSAQGKRKLF